LFDALIPGGDRTTLGSIIAAGNGLDERIQKESKTAIKAAYPSAGAPLGRRAK
jgi:hypothetical protein